MFVIQASPRSGSHMLGLALRQHPDISYFDELLSNYAMPHLAKLSATEVLQKAQAECKTIQWGLTVHNDIGILHSLGHKDIWSLLVDQPVIKLRRKNSLEQAVSLARASKTRKWHSSGKTKRVSIWFDEVINAHCRLLYCEQQISQFTFNNMISISYEDLVQDWQPTIHKVLDFLGVKQVDLQPTTVKIGHPVSEQTDMLSIRDTILDGVIV